MLLGRKTTTNKNKQAMRCLAIEPVLCMVILGDHRIYTQERASIERLTIPGRQV